MLNEFIFIFRSVIYDTVKSENLSYNLMSKLILASVEIQE